MKIAVQGCCHGDLHKIYQTLANLEKQKSVKVDLLLVCGDFQAIRNQKDLETMACPPKYRHMGDFKDYYDGTCVAPVTTIFIGGNHEASNFLKDLYYGGWVCPNIYYLGHSGVINFGGLRIAGISGILYPRDYKTGYYEKEPFSPEMIRSAYHYREFEIKKLMKIQSEIDIFLSHEWPTEIYNHGNTVELLRKKPYFRNEIDKNELGSKPLNELMGHLKPKNWFCAHLHVGFDATKVHPDGSKTNFMALDKCLPNRDYLRIVDIDTKSIDTNPELNLEYDEEWLNVLKDAEPFMNYSRGYWSIPNEFLDIDAQKSNSIAKELLDNGGVIQCPKIFNGSEINQTRQLKMRFLSEESEEAKSVEIQNPEEIKLDL